MSHVTFRKVLNKCVAALQLNNLHFKNVKSEFYIYIYKYKHKFGGKI